MGRVKGNREGRLAVVMLVAWWMVVDRLNVLLAFSVCLRVLGQLVLFWAS